MDVPQDVDVDLKNLNKCIATGERESLLSSLRTKYSKILAKIQEKDVVNGITLQRDRLGQPLLPENNLIPLSMKTSQLIMAWQIGQINVGGL